MKTLQTLIAAIACVLSFAASAQWQWIDKDGHKVFSDRAPPLDVPDKNILKQPGSRAKSTDIPAATGTDTSQTAAPGKPNALEKALEERKKQAAEAEAAKTRATDERVSQMQAENCNRARQGKASLDSGQRMVRTNAQGEREFLDDAGREQEAQRLQTIINSDCK